MCVSIGQEFHSNVNEGQSKLSLTCQLGNTTSNNTSVQGRDVLQREMEHMQREWEDYINLMQHAETSLDQTMGMWGDFEAKFEQFAQWLKAMEAKVKGHELKNTSQEKQAQVEKFKVSCSMSILTSNQKLRIYPENEGRK